MKEYKIKYALSHNASKKDSMGGDSARCISSCPYIPEVFIGSQPCLRCKYFDKKENFKIFCKRDELQNFPSVENSQVSRFA